MSATYQPSYAAYDSHATHNYTAASAQSNRPKVRVADSQNLQYLRYPPQPVQQPVHQQALQYDIPSTSHQVQRDSDHLARPPTPTSEATMPSQESQSRRNSDTLIFHSLQIPKCISPAGGNLADFAAQMTCLFWFQSTDDLKNAESIRSIPVTATLPRLSSLAKPYDQFRKWVLNVLQTTQVTQNVILLALLFIYRLKMSTPQIKGRAGSEYRLLTVALMLGNKFLDDNTYTNKTWAEVSCFAVQEIHVMEVEFLSNMRYNLLASKEIWESWITKLACFHEYYDRALRQPASPLHTAAMFQSPMSSPKANMLHMMPDMPPYTPTTFKTFSPTSSHSQDWHTVYQANAASPLASKPVRLTTSRKRSPEYDAADHPAKRQMAPHIAPVIVPGNGVRISGAVEARLPVPQLSVVTSQAQPAGAPYLPTAPSYTPVPSMPLPPLQLGVRAMSTVYQQPLGGNASQQQLQPQAQQQMMPVVTTAPSYPVSATATHPPVNLGTPSKRRSPGHLVHYTSSPMIEPYGAVSAMHTPLALTPLANSPSIYLQQRSSPYKPIRHVNRLLHPASASLDQYHLSVPIHPNQIHYQPLGRRNDVRTGVVPEFVMYNRQQQQQMVPQSLHQGVYP
ncbi:mucin [Cordyceps militaris CM01]|uniref:Mucin n=1 Tax=Cordyceps militaris (strain CM01) TaxID=983644 RepID=G3JPJ7_CORMM|nr:mucin [Cordyceps militaris CM01]EGX89807.1 mucin [Cordyceps militaris CM01]